MSTQQPPDNNVTDADTTSPPNQQTNVDWSAVNDCSLPLSQMQQLHNQLKRPIK